MSDMRIIRKEELDHALDQKYRLYLTGQLQKPQAELEHFVDDIEVGISYYKEFTADKPHVHPVATEHGYVLEGCVRLKMLDGSNEEHELHTGDFFVFSPNQAYATKNKAGTKVLFIKSPQGNDKTLVEADEQTLKWLTAWDV